MGNKANTACAYIEIRIPIPSMSGLATLIEVQFIAAGSGADGVEYRFSPRLIIPLISRCGFVGAEPGHRP